MKRFALSCLLVWVAFPLLASAQTSTKKDFLAYAKTQVGRWVGDVTWVTDWPGLGKKGEKVKAYWESSMTEDGNAVLGKFYGGNGSGTTLIIYDAGTKQIIETSVSSGGTVWRSVVTREGDKFVMHLKGSNPDGKKIKATSTLTLSDNGKTAIWTGSGTVGDEKTKQRDVWKRVN